MSHSERDWRGLLAVLCGASVVGLSAIFVKWAIAGGATPFTVGFYRMLVALPGAAWLARRTGGWGEPGGRRWAVAGGVAFSADLALWHQAMRTTTAANATLLVGLSPVWVALLAAAIWKRRFGLRGWTGQAIGLAGALVLAWCAAPTPATGAARPWRSAPASVTPRSRSPSAARGEPWPRPRRCSGSA